MAVERGAHAGVHLRAQHRVGESAQGGRVLQQFALLGAWSHWRCARRDPLIANAAPA